MLRDVRSDLLFLGVAVVGSFFFVTVLGGSAVLNLFGYAGMTLAEVLSRTELNATRVLLAHQALGSLAMFLLPAAALLQRWNRQQALGQLVASAELPRPTWSLREGVLALAVLPALIPVLEWATGQWITLIGNSGIAKEALDRAVAQAGWVARMLSLPHWGDRAASAVVFILVAAVGEEWFFRGCLQRIVRARRPQWSVPVSAGLFAAFHFDLLHLPFLLAAGWVLAWLYERSGRLWVPVLAHVLHNALTYVTTLREGVGSYADFSPEPLTWLVAAGTLAAAAAFVALRRT